MSQKLHPTLPDRFQIAKTRDGVFDPSNAKSLHQLMPDVFREALEKVPEDIMTLEECKLEKDINPTKTLTRVKHAFWAEYDRCAAIQKPMVLMNIYKGVCVKSYFYGILTDPKITAWIMKPPPEYWTTLQAAHQEGLERMFEILRAPMFTAGKLDTKVAEVVLKAFQIIDVRVKGVPIQRVEQKNLNINVDATKDVNPVDPSSLTPEQMKQRIEFLQAKLIPQSNPQEVIDVEPTGVGAKTS